MTIVLSKINRETRKVTMSTAKLLILENQLGQKVRTFSVEGDSLNIVYLTEQRRVEAFSTLASLEENKIDYKLLSSLNISDLGDEGLQLQGIGAVKSASGKYINSPTYLLPEAKDDEDLDAVLKKTTALHLILVFLLMAGSWAWLALTKKDETPLVTIVVPTAETKPTPVEKRKHVKLSEHKIKQTHKKANQKIANSLKTKPQVQKHAKAVDIQRIGALAALGGVPNGKRGYEGLDSKSMEAIRAAGMGNGGGGVGSAGRGGIKGYMPGNGLIAGSRGEGGRAQSAGGYGTRGVGGGEAGYGKLNKVGGTARYSLPSNDEVSVEGGLDRDQIIAVINRHQGEIIYCYERGLQTAPQIGGRVAVDFVIGPAGRITTARVTNSSLRSPTVENCMLAKMRNWQFPRPVGNVDVDVNYPFELTRVSSR